MGGGKGEEGGGGGEGGRVRGGTGRRGKRRTSDEKQMSWQSSTVQDSMHTITHTHTHSHMHTLTGETPPYQAHQSLPFGPPPSSGAADLRLPSPEPHWDHTDPGSRLPHLPTAREGTLEVCHHTGGEGEGEMWEGEKCGRKEGERVRSGRERERCGRVRSVGGKRGRMGG